MILQSALLKKVCAHAPVDSPPTTSTAGAVTNAPDASRIICNSKRRCQDLHAAARSRRRGRPLGDSSCHTVAASLRLLPPGHVLKVAPAACAVATMAVSRHRHLCCRLLDMLIFSGQGHQK